MTTLGEIKKVVDRADSVALFMHIRPDGDTVGSALALKLALQSLGKTVDVFCEDLIPSSFSFLGETECVKTEKSQPYALLMAIDCAEITRVGKFAWDFNNHKNTVNIDHHITNSRYAKLNYVVDSAANCENVYHLIKELGAEITPQIANLLATGILTDTGNFYHKNLTSQTLRIAGDLVDLGADINNISFHVFHSQSKERALLFGRVMSKLKYYLDGKFAVATIFQKDIEEAGAKPSETEGFIDFVMEVNTVEVGASIMEMERNKFKVSLRSKRANVSEVAGVFGGGGHVLASGCRLEGVYEEVLDKLIYAVKQRLPE